VVVGSVVGLSTANGDSGRLLSFGPAGGRQPR
jgi:hypothetical protein